MRFGWRFLLGLICTAFALNFGWAGFWVWLAGVIVLFITTRPGQIPAIIVVAVTGFIASFQADGRDLDINFGRPSDVDVNSDGILGLIGGMIGFIGWGWLLFGGCLVAAIILYFAPRPSRP